MRNLNGSESAGAVGPLGLRIAPVIPILALMLSACSDGSSEALAVPTWQLVALSPIGGESVEEGGFGRIADLEIGDDGRIYVLDELNRTVRVFDDDGGLLMSFGRAGQGPGEFGGPSALAWGPQGHLWVVDPGNARFTVFDTDGRLIATRGGLDPFFDLMAVGFSNGGFLYTAGLFFEGGSLENPTALVIENEVSDTQVSERRRVALGFIEQPKVYEVRDENMALVQGIPFSSESVFRLDAHGELWFARTREPWVYRWSEGSEADQTFGREFSAPPVTEAERRELMESEEIERFRTEAGPAAFAEFAGLIPETKPHLGGFFFDDQENMWIVRSPEDGSRGSPAPIDIYDSTGALVATAQAVLEPNPRPRVREGLMAAVIRDELGVESIAMYRLQQ